jgi:hypothetical protein
MMSTAPANRVAMAAGRRAVTMAPSETF